MCELNPDVSAVLNRISTELRKPIDWCGKEHWLRTTLDMIDGELYGLELIIPRMNKLDRIEILNSILPMMETICHSNLGQWDHIFQVNKIVSRVDEQLRGVTSHIF